MYLAYILILNANMPLFVIEPTTQLDTIALYRSLSLSLLLCTHTQLRSMYILHMIYRNTLSLYIHRTYVCMLESICNGCCFRYVYDSKCISRIILLYRTAFAYHGMAYSLSLTRLHNKFLHSGPNAFWSWFLVQCTKRNTNSYKLAACVCVCLLFFSLCTHKFLSNFSWKLSKNGSFWMKDASGFER